MITVDVKVSGDTHCLAYLTYVQKRIRKSPLIIMNKYASFVQRSAKVRASKNRWSATGETARSIRVESVSKSTHNPIIQVTSNSRGAPFQEEGFKPHFVAIGLLSKRAQANLANYRKTHASSSRGFGVPGFILVKKSIPIFKPAIDKANTKLDGWINDEISKALK